MDAGARHVAQTEITFTRIVGMVASARDASHEITASTGQQTVAVPQVSAAMSLTALSRALLRIVWPEAA